MYEKEKEIHDLKQEGLGLKQALKDANDQGVLLFNEVQKAWKVSSALQTDLKVCQFYELGIVFRSMQWQVIWCFGNFVFKILHALRYVNSDSLFFMLQNFGRGCASYRLTGLELWLTTSLSGWPSLPLYIIEKWVEGKFNKQNLEEFSRV